MAAMPDEPKAKAMGVVCTLKPPRLVVLTNITQYILALLGRLVLQQIATYLRGEGYQKKRSELRRISKMEALVQGGAGTFILIVVKSATFGC